MKSNLTKEDYNYLLYNSKTNKPSCLNLKIDNIKGKIECYRILISDFNRDINGYCAPPIYKYSFKLFINGDNYKEIYNFIDNNKEILVDNIKYFLGNHMTKDDEKIEFEYISYNLYDKNTINEGERK